LINPTVVEDMLAKVKREQFYGREQLYQIVDETEEAKKAI